MGILFSLKLATFSFAGSTNGDADSVWCKSHLRGLYKAHDLEALVIVAFHACFKTKKSDQSDRISGFPVISISLKKPRFTFSFSVVGGGLAILYDVS